jgi:hypothetical protein
MTKKTGGGKTQKHTVHKEDDDHECTQTCKSALVEGMGRSSGSTALLLWPMVTVRVTRIFCPGQSRAQGEYNIYSPWLIV